MLTAAKKPSTKPAPKGPKGPKCYMPTQEEIRQRCEAIRANWDERTEKMRRIQKTPPVEAMQRRMHRPTTSN